MGRKRADGEGNLYQRADGRWAGRATVHLVGGGTKRIWIYGRTQAEAAAKLASATDHDRRTLTPHSEPTVGEFLDGWLANHVAVHNRPRTLERYESVVRVHLRPALGQITLRKLDTGSIQRMYNSSLADGRSVRLVQQFQQVLRAALNHAERTGLIDRNAARHVVLPKYERRRITPWTPEQQKKFLRQADQHPWSAAYFLMLFYGLRRGEVLGLRWEDVDFEHGTLRIERQLQRLVNKGLSYAPVKSSAGVRALPITGDIRSILEAHLDRAQGNDGPIFTGNDGGPVDPKTFVKAFHAIREQAGLPHITVHHLRHIAATNLKMAGAAATDAQAILGHAHVSTTMQIYTHSDDASRRNALEKIGESLTGSGDSGWRHQLASDTLKGPDTTTVEAA